MDFLLLLSSPVVSLHCVLKVNSNRNKLVSPLPLSAFNPTSLTSNITNLIFPPSTWYLVRFVDSLVVERDGSPHAYHRVLLLLPGLAGVGVGPAPGGRQHALGDKLFQRLRDEILFLFNFLSRIADLLPV